MPDASANLLSLEELIAPATDGRGKGATPLVMGYGRSLTRGDLEALARAPAEGSALSIKAIRHNHHLLARAIAEGQSNEEASRLVGMDPQRISAMRTAPAFQELIAYYRSQESAKDIDVRKRLEGFGLTALDILAERLDATPEKFSSGELKGLVDLSLVAPMKAQPQAAAAGFAPVRVAISFIPSPHRAEPRIIGESSTVLDIDGEGETIEQD